ncbi:winged helix-turn-helix transcriptional regulator [Rhizobium lentis]|uniref:winged helix-turn-helix transcriptional regulator n=1 Tax=Rhizobium lentis TaxID=1138194 RepID=UPI001C82A60C|nr:helix-turn-helix domain-containing protein [Rhizobium lentis]MBX4998812.1 helix-turn-helix transcriptional regulator [Rhizobium lentis]MBX5017721.1 helix-turn-helix transcriptional regulator [Rhizobium lentis]
MPGKMDEPKQRPGAGCPVRGVLDRIGDQWSLLTLEALEDGKKRFNELLRDIGDVSKQMLSKTLRHLEQDGFISRTLYPEVPPRVEHELTEMGRSFLFPMKGLIGWAERNHPEIIRSRRRHETG